MTECKHREGPNLCRLRQWSVPAISFKRGNTCFRQKPVSAVVVQSCRVDEILSSRFFQNMLDVSRTGSLQSSQLLYSREHRQTVASDM